MKKIYQNVEVKLVLLSATDVLTNSQNAFDDTAEDIFTPLNQVENFS